MRCQKWRKEEATFTPCYLYLYKLYIIYNKAGSVKNHTHDGAPFVLLSCRLFFLLLYIINTFNGVVVSVVVVRFIYIYNAR